MNTALSFESFVVVVHKAEFPLTWAHKTDALYSYVLLHLKLHT